MTATVHTIDIKLAAILATEEIPQRFSQPITCTVEIRPDGSNHKQFRFWFDVSAPAHKEKAERLMNEYFTMRLDIQRSIKQAHAEGGKTINFPDTDLVKMISVQMWRDSYLNWMKNHVEPMRTVQIGGKHVTLSANATKETKDKIRKII